MQRVYIFYWLHLYCLSLVFVGCSVFSGYEGSNDAFTKNLIAAHCSVDESELEKIRDSSDKIYLGLNSGLEARYCAHYTLSNDFFNIAEESFRDDVELESIASTVTRVAANVLINDNVSAYQGMLYEKIMLNLYKGLNYLSLKDFENARIEFNRSLERQRMAKEYFSSQITEAKEELKKVDDTEYGEYVSESINSITQSYSSLMSEFKAQKNFTNPYATYLASVFLFLDKDYKKAADLFKEIVALDAKNKEFKNQYKVFEQYARSSNPQKLQKYVFVVFENGLGATKKEIALDLPFPLKDSKGKQSFILVSFAFPVLQKRSSAQASILIDKKPTTYFMSFDDVIATEFNLSLPLYITKSIISTTLKTIATFQASRVNVYAGLGMMFLNKAITKADVRSWQGLPSDISIMMIPNKGVVTIGNEQQMEQKKFSKNKNILVYIRSFVPYAPSNIVVIESL